MYTRDIEQAGDIVKLTNRDVSESFVVLETEKGEELGRQFGPSQDGYNNPNCVGDLAQSRLDNSAPPIQPNDRLLHLAPVEEMTERFPEWWQINWQFYQELGQKPHVPTWVVDESQVSRITKGPDPDICFNCGHTAFHVVDPVVIAITREKWCTRCEAINSQRVIRKIDQTTDIPHKDIERFLELVDWKQLFANP